MSPGRAAVLPRAGRPQQQARGHDAGARSGAARVGRLRRARAARRRSSSGRAATRSTSRTATPRSPGCWCRGWCPRRFPGRTTCTSIVQGRRWTTASWTMTRRAFAIRLNSTVARVAHDGPIDHADAVKVAYLRDGTHAPGARPQRGPRLLQRDDPAGCCRSCPADADGGAGLLGEGADALHERPDPTLDGVQAARRGQHQRARACITRAPASIPAPRSAATAASPRRTSRSSCTWSAIRTSPGCRARSRTASASRSC